MLQVFPESKIRQKQNTSSAGYFLCLFNELFIRISVVSIGLTLIKPLTMIQMAIGFLNYQSGQSLMSRWNGIQSISLVPQDPDSGNCRPGDLILLTRANLVLS